MSAWSLEALVLLAVVAILAMRLRVGDVVGVVVAKWCKEGKTWFY